MNEIAASDGTLNQVLAWNDKLIGLPALPLVVLGCVAFGYVLKAIPTVNNKWIPLGVYVFAMLTNLGIQPPNSVALGVRAMILGMIAGVVSTVLHRKVLRKWIDERFFDDDNGDDAKQ